MGQRGDWSLPMAASIERFLAASEHKREGKLRYRVRLRMLAVGIFGSFLLAALIDAFLLSPRLLVELTLFVWSGAALCSLLLALTNRVRYCATCELYGNFVRQRVGWVCTTCGDVSVPGS